MDIKGEIFVNEKRLNQTLIKESVKSLGTYFNPTMEWTEQFKMVREKLLCAMSKLRSTPLTAANAYVFFHICLITQVHFGCGIMTLTEAQEKELIRISEATLLQKLGLSEKFPRQILHTEKTQLGVGIMKPSTILTILSLKLYLGHKRHEDIIANQLEVNERNVAFQYGYNKNVLEVKRKLKPNQITWSDEIGERLESRNVVFVNANLTQCIRTKNKAMMDLAAAHAESKNMSEKIIAPINQVRLFKKVILPCELVGLLGNKKTKCFNRVIEASSTRWNIDFHIVPKPSKKLIST